LCQGITKTGKPRYFFSKSAAQNVLDEIPAGHHIEEGVNGLVSLVKDRKQLILPEEIQLVEETKWLCNECLSDENKTGFLCDEHVKGHPHENYVEPLPLYNSPRTEMCGL
jgi:hypothetical protein